MQGEDAVSGAVCFFIAPVIPLRAERAIVAPAEITFRCAKRTPKTKKIVQFTEQLIKIMT